MSLIRALAHVCLKTTDLEQTTRFYCEALEMAKLFRFTRRGVVIGFYLKASASTFIEVFLEETAVSSPQGRLQHFCLEIDNIEYVRSRLLQAGYAAGEIQLGADHSWQFWAKDPNDVNLEFHQYTPQSAQRSGQDVEVNW